MRSLYYRLVFSLLSEVFSGNMLIIVLDWTSLNYTFATLCTCVICYSISLLKALEVLDISENNLSEGFHDDLFTPLQSLRELDMAMCSLKALPNRCVL